MPVVREERSFRPASYVHHIYDFAVFCCPGQSPVCAAVAALTDLDTADLAPQLSTALEDWTVTALEK
jgi:hypothetical protein